MNRLRVRGLFLVFFVSGFCGLIYESIWSHYLKLILGHAAYAQAVVLVVFVGGLALGAWLASLWSERLRHPILVYAAVEAVVAVVAFGFHLLFVAASDWALDSLLPSVCESQGMCWANWLLAGALILPPATLLGTTFPLMSAGVMRLGVRPGRTLSLLYFLNSAGAALGVLASGFILIPALGLPGTLLASGVLNALVALGAYAIGRRSQGDLSLPAEPRSSTASPVTRRWLLAAAAVTGLSSFIYEVVWIRMLTQVLGAATHSFELMLASFILGLALGGWWVRDRIDSLVHPERALATVQLAMGVLAVATLPLYFWCFDAMALTMRGLSATSEAYGFFMGASAAMTMAVMLPATFCAGMTLPLLTNTLLRRGGGEREIGRAYSANTFGAILGVLVTVYWLMPAIGLKWSLATAAIIDIALGAAILWHFRQTEPAQRWPWTGPCVALGLALLVPALVPLSAATMASGVFRTGRPTVGADKVIFFRDGRTATISVLETGEGVRTLLTNGKPDGSTYPSGERTTVDDRTTVMLGVLGLAHHPQAKRAAVVGLGTGITSAVLLESGRLESVETIEIEPMVLEAAQLFRPRNEAAFGDPRSRIVIEDARAHLARSGAKYDLIVSEPSNPWVSGVAGLFTTEFYGRVARQLADQGHFVQWLHAYEASPEMVGSIIGAFSKTFPQYKVYSSNGADIVLVGRADGRKVELSPAVFDSPGMARHLRRIGIDTIEQLAAHEAGSSELVQLLFGTYGAPPNSDFFPYVDNRASRDRFMAARAVAMFQIHKSPVPFLEFGQPPFPYLGAIDSANGSMPPKLTDLAAAWHGSRLLRGGALSAQERGYLRQHVKDYELVRAWLWGCQSVPDASSWDSAVTVAGEINAGLSPVQAAALWSEVLTGRCASSLTPEQRAWVELFQAVGSRDARLAAQRADVLLAAPTRTVTQFEYLVLAGVGARLAMGQQEAARQLLNLAKIAPNRLELPWFRYLGTVLATRRAGP